MQVRLSEEVRAALADGRAVVALESSVIAQGLPRPHNLEAARRCEAAIRRAGAVPATTAVLDGVPVAGLAPAELERLASETGLLKVGSRDLAIAHAHGRTGGTTVSATCELAAAAGIRTFSTGGLGGVHRGVAEHMDVSQDLWALSRFPVAVVCAGAKSVLDLPKTMELLEALAVPVVGVGTGELPSFYSVSSGLPLEHRVESAAEAAAIARARLETLAQGGLVFALPPPAAAAIPADEVEAWIAEALAAAAAQAVRGKAVTPFLLAHLARASGGRSLAANLALLEHNAAFAGELATAYARRD
jgi:pseudouridine-5'-phosphate glycosidase